MEFVIVTNLHKGSIRSRKNQGRSQKHHETDACEDGFLFFKDEVHVFIKQSWGLGPEKWVGAVDNQFPS